MDHPPILLADFGDLITIGIFVVGGVLWLLNQILKGAKVGAPPQQRGANFPAQPVRPQQPQGAPPMAAQKVEDEISDFLRRAAQARAGGNPPGQAPRPPVPAGQPRPAQPPRPPAARPQPPRAPGAGQQPQRPPVGQPRPSQPGRGPVVAAVVVEEERSASVEEHVARHLDTRGFAARASQMTSVDQADEEMDEHIHKSLDHSVGTLTGGATSHVEPISTGQQTQRTQLSGYASAAAGLAVLLANPQNLRQAIILNEVLRPPDFDWK